MILQEYVDVKINSRNFDYYKSLIPNIKNNNVYKVLIDDIFNGSHTKILVSCDICNSVYNKPYRQYITSYEKYNLYCCSPKCAQIKNKMTNNERYGSDNVFQNILIKNKILETNLIRYNVNYPSQCPDIREKVIKTLQSNYGVDNPMFSDIVKNKISNTNKLKYGTSSYLSSELMMKYRIKNGTKIPDELKSEFEIYKGIVRKLTQKIKKDLFNSWDGYDFYDKEYIKDNLNYNFSDKAYPTMDHKISIYHGFINKIDVNILSNIKNMCITKRCINSSKNSKSIFY